ncbi:MAG: PHP domain-containing protein [Candidatus Omnitrophota bacterium]
MSKNKKRFIDLHVHTTYSDGVFSPEQVVQKALDMGLKAVAITDHDCIEGVAPCENAAKGRDIEIIPGVEISAVIEETEIHILGYYIDVNNKELVNALCELRQNRANRLKKMLLLLKDQGIELAEDKVLGEKPGGVVGRLNLARAIMKENKALNIKTVFDKYIGDGKPCYVKHKKLDYRKAIKLIRNAGGIAVLAHPGTMGKDEYIEDYVKAGLRGIEALHIKHRSEISAKYFDIAKKYDLIITGGSDCHGGNKDKALIGKIKLDYEIAEKLLQETKKHDIKL